MGWTMFKVYRTIAVRNESMKRRCNICLVNVDHLKTDKYNNDVTVCYKCQDIITRIVKENWISVGHKTAISFD